MCRKFKTLIFLRTYSVQLKIQSQRLSKSIDLEFFQPHLFCKVKVYLNLSKAIIVFFFGQISYYAYYFQLARSPCCLIWSFYTSIFMAVCIACFSSSMKYSYFIFQEICLQDSLYCRLKMFFKKGEANRELLLTK